jgi:hypothetical protein
MRLDFDQIIMPLLTIQMRLCGAGLVGPAFIQFAGSGSLIV